MGNCFLNLAKRLLKPGEGIQPRQLGRFEPAPDWIEGRPGADFSQANSEEAGQMEPWQGESEGRSIEPPRRISADRPGARSQDYGESPPGFFERSLGRAQMATHPQETETETPAGSGSPRSPESGSNIKSVSSAWVSLRGSRQPQAGLAPRLDQPGRLAHRNLRESENAPGSARPGSRAHAGIPGPRPERRDPNPGWGFRAQQATPLDLGHGPHPTISRPVEPPASPSGPQSAAKTERQGLARAARPASRAVILKFWAPASRPDEMVRTAPGFLAPEVQVKRARAAPLPFSRVDFQKQPGGSRRGTNPDPAGSHTIQVTIGVLEIRASAPALDRNVRQQPAAAVMSLDEYLGPRPRS